MFEFLRYVIILNFILCSDISPLSQKALQQGGYKHEKKYILIHTVRTPVHMKADSTKQ